METTVFGGDVTKIAFFVAYGCFFDLQIVQKSACVASGKQVSWKKCRQLKTITSVFWGSARKYISDVAFIEIFN